MNSEFSSLDRSAADDFRDETPIKIEPYRTVKSKINGFDFFHYLHIRGGAGNDWMTGKPGQNGGQYNFCAAYLASQTGPDSDNCLRSYCQANGLAYGTGDTIEDAYEELLEKLKKNPLK